MAPLFSSSVTRPSPKRLSNTAILLPCMVLPLAHKRALLMTAPSIDARPRQVYASSRARELAFGCEAGAFASDVTFSIDRQDSSNQKHHFSNAACDRVIGTTVR